jgi:aflatoxin B1 aldehyde reductase
VLYLDAPDSKVGLEVTLAEANRLHQQGLFQELGLANFPAWQVVLAFHLCRFHGWLVPTVVQGEYNMLSRDAERELFPALRAHKVGCFFLTYTSMTPFYIVY